MIYRTPINVCKKEAYFRVFVRNVAACENSGRKGEPRKAQGIVLRSPCDRLASLEIQLLDPASEQEGPLDNAQRTTRAMPPRESWSGERDENNSGEYYGTLQ